MPLAAALCHEHKHLLKDLMRTVEAQLRDVGAFERAAVTPAAAAAYVDAAEAAAPPLVELLATYEFRVAELKDAARLAADGGGGAGT